MQHRKWVGSFVVVQTNRRTDIYLSWGEVMTTLWEKKKKNLCLPRQVQKKMKQTKGHISPGNSKTFGSMPLPTFQM